MKSPISRLSSVVALAILGLPMSRCLDAAPKIPPLPSLKTFYTTMPIAHDGRADCIIAVPAGQDYLALGKRLADEFRRRTGASVPVVAGRQLSAELAGRTNAILLGYFANNPLVERLYCEYLVDLDARWPGPGGYAIRTVHDPLGRGTSFVCLGGADPDAVRKAVDDFLAMLPRQSQLAFPHTVKVVLPDGTQPPRRRPGEAQREIRAARGKNFRACGDALCRAGLSYYRSGDPDGLEVFKALVPIFHEVVRKLGSLDDMRGAIYLANIWDAIEEAPQFSPQDRAAATAMLWELTHRFTRAGRTARDLPTPEGNDWDARVAFDLARYWKKYYGLDAGGLWTWANVRGRSQAKFWRSLENCPGYGGMTMYDVVYYVLPYQYDAYWQSGTGRKMADYGMAIINNLGGIAGFGDTSAMGDASYWPDLFRAAAWKLKDGRYLDAEQHTEAAGRTTNNFFCNGFFQNEVPPVPAADTLGVRVVPLPDWVWEHRARVLSTAPLSMNRVLDADAAPPRAQCFDKITFRSRRDPQSPYLILGGPSHGYHSHPDGNAIIELTVNGRYGLFDSGYFVPDTIEHNTIVVFRDGLFEPVPRLTGLAASGDYAGLGMTQTCLNGYNGVNWRRNIVWNKEQYFLVIDEVEALQPGDYRLVAVFRTLDDHRPRPDQGRVRTVYRGKAFNLHSASHAPLVITGTTPPAPDRWAILQNKDSRLTAGAKQYFANLLYAPKTGQAWPYEIVSTGGNWVMIRSAAGCTLAGTGPGEPLAGLHVDAAVFHLEPDRIVLCAGRELRAGLLAFRFDVPANIDLRLGTIARGTIDVAVNTHVALPARGEPIKLDGLPCAVRRVARGLELEIPPGKHSLEFAPLAASVESGSWQAAYRELERRQRDSLAKTANKPATGRTLAARWKFDNAQTKAETVYVNRNGQPVEELTPSGTPRCWTDAQRGSDPRSAVDRNPATYTATSSGTSWSFQTPKDIGLEWNEPVKVGCFEVDYYDRHYAPASDGHKLQVWDGTAWQAVQAAVRVDPSGAHWSYEFPARQTTRIRVLVTRFGGMRTAVREIRAFPEAARPESRGRRVPLRTRGLAVADIDGCGKAEVLVAAGDELKCIRADGTPAWRRTLAGEALALCAYDLDGDGRLEVVAGSSDGTLWCFDCRGNPRWSTPCPADPYLPEIEPHGGPIEVLACGDIDGDGKGEIIAGAGNWFAYAYSAGGRLLWKALNWAHHPTSIALARTSDGRRAALLGTTYCSANLFGPTGKQIATLPVGYHGAAMCVAASDMDGNGKDELVAGSRIGGLHCTELGTKKSWDKFMGAEITRVVLVDLRGDGKRQIVAGSKNHYLLAADAEGKILWNCNVGGTVLDLAVVQARGQSPRIAVATEEGRLRLVSSDGRLLATLETGAEVDRVAAGDLSGAGSPAIVAATADGYVYGDIR